MRHFVKLSSKILFGFMVCAGLVSTVWFARAQESSAPTTFEWPTTPEVSPEGDFSKTFTVATVNVQDGILLEQKENTLRLAFTLSNREGVQPKIIYAVNLLRQDSSGEDIVVDQKVYDDVVSLGSSDSVRKEIDYVAPEYLKGEYVLEIEARNPDGLIFGMTNILDPITLSGSGEYIAIDQESCFLTVEGEDASKQYTLVQGVDIASEETLVAHCSLKSLFATEQTITPSFVSRYRSVFGKIVQSEHQESLSIKPNQTVTFTAKLPKLIEPQAYDSVLTFTNEQGEPIASSVAFHFVLRGASATIQNVTLDKDGYKKDETAQVMFVWSGSADGFPESRLGFGDGDTRVVVRVSLTDDKKNPCAEPLVYQLDAEKTGGAEMLTLPLSRDCWNPVVSASITDQNGKVLADNTYEIVSKNISPTETVDTNSSATEDDDTTQALLFSIAAFLAIIALTVYLIRKNMQSGTGMTVVFGLIMGAGVLLGTSQAKADTFFTVDYIWGAHHFVVNTFTVNINKASYGPGESILASGRYVSSLCNNGEDETIRTRASIAATIDGVQKNVRNRVTAFTAQNSGGSYTALFEGHTTSPWLTNALGSTNIPYKVVAPSTNGACGSADGKDYPTNRSSYAPDTQCASGVSSDTTFPTPGKGASWMCQGSGGGSDASCSATRNLPKVLKICPSNPSLQLTLHQGEARELGLFYDTRTDCFDTSGSTISVSADTWKKIDVENVIASLVPSSGPNTTVTAISDGSTVDRSAKITATYGTEIAEVTVTVVAIPPYCVCDPATIADTCSTDTFTTPNPSGTCTPKICAGTRDCGVMWKEIPPTH